VTDTTPANGATGVARKNAIVLTFSTTLDAATLGVGTISLTTAATGIQAYVASVAGNKLTITPLIPLAAALAYRLTVGTGLRGAGGESLTEPVTMTFTTADRRWQTASRLEPVGPTTAERPKVVADAKGNAIAVWQRRDGQTRSIWSNRFTVGTGWGMPVQISTIASATSVTDGAEIDVDASGNVIAVWDQSDDGIFRIWSNRYIAGIGWGTAVRIQTRTSTTGNALIPHVAFDALGNALAVWEQSESGVLGIWSNRYSAGGDWGTAVPVETNPGDAGGVRIAFDDLSGRAFAVWSQRVGTCTCIWSNQFTVAGGWGTPQMIASGTGVNALTPQISVDGFGNAYAVWTESDGVQFDIWSNRFRAGADWDTAVKIDDRTGGAGAPQVVADLSGSAYAVWVQQGQPGSPAVNIHWNLYKPGTGWGTAGLLAPATDIPTGTGGSPAIALDPNGIAHALWEHDDGARTHVRSSRLMPAGAWTQPLDTGSTDAAASPAIAVDPSGDVTAVWEQGDGAGVAVWANRFE
jgi:hypothetical protein